VNKAHVLLKWSAAEWYSGNTSAKQIAELCVSETYNTVKLYNLRSTW